MRIPPLTIKIMFESNPLISIMLAGRLPVPNKAVTRVAYLSNLLALRMPADHLSRFGHRQKVQEVLGIPKKYQRNPYIGKSCTGGPLRGGEATVD